MLVAAAVGLSYMLLRRPSPPTHVPVLDPVIAETSSPSSRYTASHTSSTPLFGQFQDMPREIHGWPQQLPEMGTGR